ncbi:site-2 protease family protein [Tautonia plasticadhaerens]|uniref:Peptidase family M50 n=1 Tax=Tautonia plasticadhaerens TaxID=2527974 RepID=A0A518GZZ7_9BACT|nr:site-2 protease family protein [Tautonia plasticadhaerens]QDV34160.1 Peptidase family M50 [Tautonia plasticadhaerens]
MLRDPSTPGSVPAGQAAEYLTARLRPDLVVQPVPYEGVTHYVIKDPIALKYFRFKAEEYFLLQELDGKKTLQDIKRAFERKYRPQTITVEDLLRFVAQLHEASLVLVDTPDQAKALVKRKRKNRWKKVMQGAANILYIKIPVIDPEKLLTWMYPYFRWIFTSYFVVFSLGLMLAAMTLIFAQWDTFTTKLPTFESFFNWRTLPSLWLSLAIIKIIHEFGHGLTAKHYGSEVHEMGMLFLVLTPALYCDVTDSWLLPNKWKRIWIAAAGIYVECFLAAVATFVWWNTQPGLFNSLMLSTMFICSVNTILFNANPLLRYDGYYVTSDYLEIPNLRIKSTQFFAYLFQEKVLGLEVPVQSYMPRSRRTLFVTYAVASYVYRWVITFSIIFFLYHFLPEKLRIISAFLAMGALVPLLLMPLTKMFKFVRQPGRMRKVKKVRAALCFAGAAAVIAGILLIPTPLRVKGTLVLTPAKPERIYVEVPGRLVSIDVRDNQPVEGPRPDGTPGTVIARLSNLDLLREVNELGTEIQVNEVKALVYDQTSSGGDQGPLNRALHVETVEMIQQDLQPKLDVAIDQRGKLVLTAGRDGIAMGVPNREVTGKWLQPGELFCEIGDPKALEAHLLIDQSDIDLIKHGYDGTPPTAWVKIYGRSRETIISRVEEIARRNRQEIPPELSNMAGGEIATKPDQETGGAVPLTTVYEVIIPIDNADLALQPGQRGMAKIDGGTATLGWWLWRTITKTFRFVL